jgi:hypothetical protein
MSEESIRSCAKPCSGDPPRLLDVKAPERIDLQEYLFLATLPPCCAQSALPYWAKVTGILVNTSPEDILASVTVTLQDLKGASLASYVDEVFLDAGETSSFEVKLTEFRDKTAGYTINITVAA